MSKLTDRSFFDLTAAPSTVSNVALLVHNLDQMVSFYRDLLGLEVFSHSASMATLGLGSPFLTLNAPGQLSRSLSQSPGLFHTAFLLPSRRDLRAWFHHVISSGFHILGAADHNVSEAIYLEDPEGNGLEVYADLPPDVWRSASGELYMPSNQMDLADLPRVGWDGAPTGTVVGHVHLRTTHHGEAEAFWRSLGFDVTARYPGAAFLGAGGYHQQIAANVWSSRSRPPRHDQMAGLSSIALKIVGMPSQNLIAPSGITVKINPEEGKANAH